MIVRVGKFKLEFNSEIELKFKITDTNNPSTRIRMGDEDEGEPDRGFTVLAERVKPELKKVEDSSEEIVFQTVDKTLTDLVKMREDEGKNLEKDILNQILQD